MPLLGMVKELALGPGDRIVRDFLNISIVCQVVSSNIALFCVCITIIIYEGNGSIIRIGQWFDLDIVC